MQFTFTDTTKERLDRYLTAHMDISRSQIQHMIKNNMITVNGAHTNPHHFLKEGDVIVVNEADYTDRATVKIFEPNKKITLDIIYEDDNYLIINKQPGILVHPTEQMEPATIANGLLARYPAIKDVGDNPLRPGIVHRLDKNVSGVLLVAKTQEAFDYYKNLFKARTITKKYLALVHGIMEQPHGEITLNISRSKSKGRMAAHPEGSELGKEARTDYNVLEQFAHLALLDLQIHTGRTHQIRAHLNAIEHPIVGDPLYKQRNVKQRIDIDRPFLHAYELSFTDQDGNEVTYTSPLPKDLEKILKGLRNG